MLTKKIKKAKKQKVVTTFNPEDWKDENWISKL